MTTLTPINNIAKEEIAPAGDKSIKLISSAEPQLDTPWRGEKASMLTNSLSSANGTIATVEKTELQLDPISGEKISSSVLESSQMGEKSIIVPVIDDDDEEDDLKGSKIKKNIRKKYFLTNDNIRLKLIDLVQNHNISIKQAAQFLSLNYSTANSIIRLYKKEGRIIKKNSGTTQMGEGNPLIDPLNPQNTFKLPMNHREQNHLPHASGNAMMGRMTHPGSVQAINLVDPARGSTGNTLYQNTANGANTMTMPTNLGVQSLPGQNFVTIAADGMNPQLSQSVGTPITYAVRTGGQPGEANFVGNGAANYANLANHNVAGHEMAQSVQSLNPNNGQTYISGPFITSSNTTSHSFNATGVINGAMPLNLGNLSAGMMSNQGLPRTSAALMNGSVTGQNFPVSISNQSSSQKNVNIVLGGNGTGQMGTSGMMQQQQQGGLVHPQGMMAATNGFHNGQFMQQNQGHQQFQNMQNGQMLQQGQQHQGMMRQPQVMMSNGQANGQGFANGAQMMNFQGMRPQ